MFKRWIGYLAVWLSCLILFLLHREWSSCIIFAAVTGLPPISLLLMRRTIRSTQPQVRFPKALTLGDTATADVTITCRGPKPCWQARITLQHSFTGEIQKLKPGDPLPTQHCGSLLLSVGGIYILDPLGLFRFRLAQPQQLCIPIRPQAEAPENLPELGDKVSTVWRPRRGGGFSENHDLRLYRPGDSLQQIHWKLSAKTGSLILREPMEALHSRLLLRLDIKGTPEELDRKLSQLLWLSRYLLGKRLPHHWQILSASGLESFSITDEESLTQALDTLLRRFPAMEGSVLQQPSHAAWWYYIGGDSHEES